MKFVFSPIGVAFTTKPFSGFSASDFSPEVRGIEAGRIQIQGDR
jgi:hypothetical protein